MKTRWLQPNENIKKKSLYQRKWLQTEAGIAYRKRHSEYAKKWRRNNNELRKSIQARSYNKIRIECFTHYGNGKIECKCCGEKELLFLHLDHKNGDGANQRKLWQNATGKKVFGGTDFYYWLKKNNYPDLQLQILCANCNFGKRSNKYCPHELHRGIDMNGNKIPLEELPKPYPKITRRLRGEAIKEAELLGTNVDALRQKRWRAKQRLLHPLIPKPQTTHCKNGHAYTKDTLYEWVDSQGLHHRQCRQCKRDYKQRVKKLDVNPPSYHNSFSE